MKIYDNDCGIILVESINDLICPACKSQIKLNFNNDHGYTSGENVKQSCKTCGNMIEISRVNLHKLSISIIDKIKVVDKNPKPHPLDCENCTHNTVCKYAEIPVEEITKNQELPEIWAYDEDDGVMCNMFKGV